MQLRNLAFAALAVLSLSGCMGWPSSSQGGYSEHRAPLLPMSGKPAVDKFVIELRDRFQCESDRLDAVREVVAARQTFTGQLLQPQATQLKARRELYGKLPSDAQISIDKLSTETTALADRFGEDGSCSVPPPCGLGTRGPTPVARPGMCLIKAPPVVAGSIVDTTAPIAPVIY